MKKLIRFAGLSSGERRLLVEALVVTVGVRVSLWLAPFRVLLARMDRFARSQGNKRPKSLRPERIVWAVQTASRYVPQSTCVVQALTLQIILGRYGRPSRVQIGVAKGDGQPLEAHAWIEIDGQDLLGGAEVERYRPLLHQDPDTR